MAIGPRLRFLVFKRDNYTCQYCGRKAPEVRLHLDHVQARSKGGKDEEENLITSCKDCNLGKGVLEVVECPDHSHGAECPECFKLSSDARQAAQEHYINMVQCNFNNLIASRINSAKRTLEELKTEFDPISYEREIGKIAVLEDLIDIAWSGWFSFKSQLILINWAEEEAEKEADAYA